MEVALRRTYDATPDPKLVVAVGDCGACGGSSARGTRAAVRSRTSSRWTWWCRVVHVSDAHPGGDPRGARGEVDTLCTSRRMQSGNLKRATTAGDTRSIGRVLRLSRVRLRAMHATVRGASRAPPRGAWTLARSPVPTRPVPRWPCARHPRACDGRGQGTGVQAVEVHVRTIRRRARVHECVQREESRSIHDEPVVVADEQAVRVRRIEKIEVAGKSSLGPGRQSRTQPATRRRTKRARANLSEIVVGHADDASGRDGDGGRERRCRGICVDADRCTPGVAAIRRPCECIASRAPPEKRESCQAAYKFPFVGSATNEARISPARTGDCGGSGTRVPTVRSSAICVGGDQVTPLSVERITARCASITAELPGFVQFGENTWTTPSGVVIATLPMVCRPAPGS